VAVPDFQTFMLPALQEYADGKERASSDARAGVAKKLGLSANDIAEPLPSSRHSRFTNRVAWAHTYLRLSGLLQSVRRGHYQITDRGREVLSSPPARIDIQFLERFPDLPRATFEAPISKCFKAPSKSNQVSNHLVWQARVLTAVLLTSPALPAVSDESADPPNKSDYSVGNPTPDDLMRAFSTDRPPKANSPYTVDAGHFQYETDLAVLGYGTADGTTIHDWTVLDPTLKVGFTSTIDAELQITPYQSATTKTAAGHGSLSGLGDTVGRIKFNVLGDDQGAVSIALLPYIKFPTARIGLGNGKVEGGLILPVSFSAPAGFTVIVMPEGDILKNDVGNGYHGALDFLVNVSHPLDKRWTIYTEIFTTQSFDSQYSPVYTFDAALTYAITPNWQFDLGGNFGLNRVTPHDQVYAGLAQRF